MNKTQKKSLEQASKILKTFDTFPLYEAVNDAFKKTDISEDNKKLILKALQEESYKLKQISEDAKEWIDVVIEDLQ